MRNRKAIACIACVLAAAILPAAGYPDSDGERAVLERLVKEINALEPLIQEGERQADSKDRRHFAYDWFRQDLERMKSGIREHLERPRTEPNPVQPLAGAYQR